MLTDSRFLWGVALGTLLSWWLYGVGTVQTTTVGAGGIVPKGLKREGRLLQGHGRQRTVFWPFGTTKG